MTVLVRCGFIQPDVASGCSMRRTVGKVSAVFKRVWGYIRKQRQHVLMGGDDGEELTGRAVRLGAHGCRLNNFLAILFETVAYPPCLA